MKVSAKGFVTIEKNGEIIYEGKNVIVDTGFSMLAKACAADTTGIAAYMAMGSSGAATTGGMTALQGTEHDRQALSSITASGANVIYSATLGAGVSGTQTVRELGIFSDTTAGTMLCRFITSSFTMTSADSIAVTWTIQFGEPD